jgi:hypothetical protein
MLRLPLCAAACATRHPIAVCRPPLAPRRLVATLRTARKATSAASAPRLRAFIPRAAPSEDSRTHYDDGRESDRDEEEFDTVAGAVEVVDEDEAEVRTQAAGRGGGGIP